jgi:hypothetical protein
MVREAFDLLLTDRYTMEGICEELAARGYTRSNGLPWVWKNPKTGIDMDARPRLFEIFHNPFYAGWAVSERFGIKMGEVKGQWEPLITQEEFLKGLEILKKHDQDKSRDRRYFYLLKSLLWVEVQGKTYKMTGSSPRTRFRMYAYYSTHSKPDGKDINIQCGEVDQQIPSWLEGIAINADRLPAIRKEYRSQVIKFHERDREDQAKKIKTQLTQLQGEEARLGRLFITGKISEETYAQLRAEWQVNIRTTESRLVEAERNIQAILVDLDLALILLSKVSILYERLDEKSQAMLLKILAKRIMINPEGRIIGQELNSPFTYLRSIAESLEASSSPCRGSEQVREGAPKRTA